MHNKRKNYANCYLFYFMVLFFMYSCSATSNSYHSNDVISESNQPAVVLPSDQEKLVEVALNHPEWKFREQAVKQIHNQEVLKKVVLTDSAWSVRESAINFISEPKILAQIVVKTSDWKVREIAFKNLSDQDLLVQIAQNVMGDPAVRSAAIEKISSQNVIAQIGLSDPVPFVRIAAVWKLKNMETLIKIAQADSNNNVRIEAIKYLLSLEGSSTEKEAIQIKTLLIDPSIYEHFGQLRLEYRVVEKNEDYLPDENKYSLASKQKIVVKMEYKTVSILNKYKHIIYERTYKIPIGIASGSIDAASYDSILGRRYDSAVDLSEICYVLIKSFDNENLLSLLNSKSDCLKTAASIRLEDN